MTYTLSFSISCVCLHAKTISWRAGLQLPTSGLCRTSNARPMTCGTHSSGTSSSGTSSSSPTLKVLHRQPQRWHGKKYITATEPGFR
jgi:Fe-S-cluster containining protein